MSDLFSQEGYVEKGGGYCPNDTDISEPFSYLCNHLHSPSDFRPPPESNISPITTIWINPNDWIATAI